ncbi:MAG: NfeD family protein [Trueperella sp.]|nr:NfeD family protein [Trueperella sp.]
MAWGIWAIVGVVLLILETLTVDFTFLMVAAGAFAAAGVSAVAPDSLLLQILAGALVAILLLLFVRPYIKRHINDRATGSSNIDALRGQSAYTLTTVDVTGGRVKIGGEVWTAKSYGPSIPADTQVVVTGVEGASAVVKLVSPKPDN